MADDHIEMLRHHIVDIELIDRRFEQGFSASVLLRYLTEFRVSETEFITQFTFFVADGHLGSPLAYVDS